MNLLQTNFFSRICIFKERREYFAKGLLATVLKRKGRVGVCYYASFNNAFHTLALITRRVDTCVRASPMVHQNERKHKKKRGKLISNGTLF